MEHASYVFSACCRRETTKMYYAHAPQKNPPNLDGKQAKLFRLTDVPKLKFIGNLLLAAFTCFFHKSHSLSSLFSLALFDRHE